MVRLTLANNGQISVILHQVAWPTDCIVHTGWYNNNMVAKNCISNWRTRDLELTFTIFKERESFPHESFVLKVIYKLPGLALQKCYRENPYSYIMWTP